MCRTAHAVLSTAICGIQMLVRVFMTVILMLENVIRMLLQTFYNFISFVLQMISLIPICFVFLLTARLKCFMCGGGGPCPVNRGGACDCLMSLLAIIILFFIFRATGVLDKIFYSMGYAKAPKTVARFIPTPGDITECSRNDTYPSDTTTTSTSSRPSPEQFYEAITDDDTTITSTMITGDDTTESTLPVETSTIQSTVIQLTGTVPTKPTSLPPDVLRRKDKDSKPKWTTAVYYLL